MKYAAARRTICGQVAFPIWCPAKSADYQDASKAAEYCRKDPAEPEKENIGYEIVVLYEGEERLLRLLQPDEDLKYIIILPHIGMANGLKLPDAPCLFATVDYCGEHEPEVYFYTEEAILDGKESVPANVG